MSNPKPFAYGVTNRPMAILVETYRLSDLSDGAAPRSHAPEFYLACERFGLGVVEASRLGASWVDAGRFHGYVPADWRPSCRAADEVKRATAAWPYGDATYHQGCCLLFEGADYCDCRASDASDTEYGFSDAAPGSDEP